MQTTRLATMRVGCLQEVFVRLWWLAYATSSLAWCIGCLHLYAVDLHDQKEKGHVRAPGICIQVKKSCLEEDKEIAFQKDQSRCDKIQRIEEELSKQAY
jgi:hypothetical protein